MKFLKFSLTLCLSLVVSSMLLPGFSYALEDCGSCKQTNLKGSAGGSDGNPYASHSFTPLKADSDIAEKANCEIPRIECEIRNLRAPGSAFVKAERKLNTAAGYVGQGGGLFSQSLTKELRKSLEGDEGNEEDQAENMAAVQAELKKVQQYAGQCQPCPAEFSSITNPNCQRYCAASLIPQLVIDYTDAYNEILSLEDELKTWENIKHANGKGREIWYTMVKDKDGNDVPVYFEKRDDDTYTALSGTSEGCTPLPAKLAESKECVFCPLFLVLFNAANKMSELSFSGLAGPLSIALVIGFAIYIAFKVMTLVSGFTKQDGPKFVTELLIQSFKVLVAVVLLINYSFVYDYVIKPLLIAGLDFGSSFLFEAGQTAKTQCLAEYAGKLKLGDKDVSNTVLSRELYWNLHCFILGVQYEIALPQAIGSTLMCISTNAAAGNFIVKNIIPDFSMMIQGLVIWGFSLVVSLAFAFYLIDATVRIGIIGALLPFMLATWPFKITSKYSSTGFTMLMNTFFTYAFVGLVLSVNVQLMGQSLGGEGGFRAIQDKINGNNVNELQKLLDIGIGGFLVLICCCLFGFKLTGQSSQLADQMAGGGGGEGIGGKIGGLAASAVKGGAKAAGGAAAKGGKAAAGAVKAKRAENKAKKEAKDGNKDGDKGGDKDSKGGDKGGDDAKGGDKGGDKAAENAGPRKDGNGE